MSDKCKSCNTKIIYDMKCSLCRNRLLMDEPCKYLRKQIAGSITKYGALGDWQIPPHCGCTNKCKRIENMRLAKANG